MGGSFGVDSLTDGKVYECLGLDGNVRIIDDSEEDYLYIRYTIPRPLDGSSKGGKWEIVEDDERGTLQKLFHA